MVGRHRLGIVDDDPSIRESLSAYLRAEGYLVSTAGNADELEALLQREPLALLLLDIRLPDKDGLALTRELRQKSEIGIILVTGRGDKVDRILGLEYGADDYLTKPIEARELLPRVRNLLRRIENAPRIAASKTRQFGNFQLDLHRRRLATLGGCEIRLTTGEYELLAVFIENAGCILTRQQLLKHVTHRRWDPFDRTIDTLVRRLRRKIEPDPDHPSFITTVHGTGYLFAG